MTNNPLVGESLELRAPEPEDLEILYQWENNTDIWNVSDRQTPLSKYLLKTYLQNAQKDIYETRQLRLIIQVKDSGKAVGAIDLFDFDPFHKRAGIGILIADAGDRRKGYAREALQMLIKYAFDTLKLNMLYCSISTGNKASLYLFEQSGFKVTGTKKQWYWGGIDFLDEYFLQIIR